ncbi:predicted protein [Pediculus humanus corporis]|uniref:Predicted protein n=1 Tax=Pediculus humanus subsp. corporis TaxID=121224 RepID=E0VJZ4_PEDHC|nr:uncharacterized protein Phum_PHUM253710 [Pediculus humanus corporis]EEB13700.1 predicted protein [Pediculus humanus corporis]
MALFKKPKKNIRTRNIEKDDDDLENSENLTNDVSKKRDKEKDIQRSKQTTLLSFGDEEEDGEVFQIKKSPQSKKLVRLLDKERKKKKDVQNKDGEETQQKKVEVSNDDIVVILKNDEEEKIKQEKLLRESKPIILNGRAALAAGKDDLSSSDDEGSTRHKFSQPDRARIMIESGKIPDAATIHAARKKRQRARELGADYIPVDVNQKYNSKSKSRLIGEDNEGSDEDEKRIDMSVHIENRDRDHQLENFYNEEPLAPEEDEWENQQIRKGVTGVTVVNSQPSSALQEHQTNQTLFTNVIAPQNKELPTPDSIIDKVKERLNTLKDIHTRHLQDKERAEADLKDCIKEASQLESEAPGLAEKFRFYQEMRGYVTDLVECLDEKMPGLLKLEEKANDLWTERSEYFAERRRQDVRDQADEMSPFAKNPAGGLRWSKEEEEAKSRRAAEREGRRTRRRRTRELKSLSSSHIDGMSSDDELTESELTAFKLKLDGINRLGEGLLADVEDDFGTIDGVACRLELWRKFDLISYTEAYASLCLPKLLGPLVRFNTLTWNPILGDVIDLECTRWWGRLLLYGMREKETCESLANDPDVLLVPLIIERVIIPKLTQLIKCSWDPMSSSQTLRLVGLLGKYVNETPTLGPKSRHLEALLQGIVDKLKSAVDNDVFIPINLKMYDGNSSVFFQRQFASAVKLLRNILSFQGFIGSEHLQEIALDSLLNRYLMAALRTCTPCDAIQKANMIIMTFPRWWFQKEAKIKKLEMFTKHLKLLATQVHEYDSTENVNSLIN